MATLTLRNYQRIGTCWLKQHKRGLLADAAGLGKTLQAATAAEKPVLVVAPTYSMKGWYRFIREQFPDDWAILVDGPRQKRTGLIACGADWTIVNIEMLRTYTMRQPMTLIIDESHRVRGRNAQQSKAAYNLALTTPYVYLLSATPMYRRADDLFMQLRIVAPRIFTSYWKFVNEYLVMESNEYGVEVRGIRNERVFKNMLNNFMLVRDYDDVGMELPDAIEKPVYVNMPRAMRKVYDNIKYEYRIGNMTITSVIGAMHTLRTVTAALKIQAIMDMIEDLPPRCLFYTWYRETASALAGRINATLITGDTPAAQRADLANGSKGHVVANIAALSESVSLVDFDDLIFVEEDWSFGSMYQTIRRVRRFGRRRPVKVHYLWVEDSIDMRVHEAIQEGIGDARIIMGRELEECTVEI